MINSEKSAFNLNSGKGKIKVSAINLNSGKGNSS